MSGTKKLLFSARLYAVYKRERKKNVTKEADSIDFI